jgi:hypothetical protein
MHWLRNLAFSWRNHRGHDIGSTSAAQQSGKTDTALTTSVSVKDYQSR